jgi:nitroimidazol reductase NimA-like FMN-containing flavoprotein (pyridoxamine 5'-phosphate oxidase superfamily)
MDTISETRARDFLEAAPVAHIGVVSDGEPYVSPMSFVVDDNRILFRTKPGRRFAALEANPAVSIEVSSYDASNGDWMSVIVRGTAHETTDDAIISVTVEKLFEKYREVLGSPLGRGGIQPLSTFPHVVVVDIDEISGMAATGGFEMRTRPGRL